MSLERLELRDGSTDIERQHLARYEWASGFVRAADVLDCACGTGYGSHRLAVAGARSVIGVDASPEAIATARSSAAATTVQYRVDDAQTLATVVTSSCDVVVSFETIEHVPDDAAFIRQVARVLRPGGRFLVSTPDFRTGGLQQRFTGKVANPFHVREYTLNELVRRCGSEFRLQGCHGQMPVRRGLLLPPVELVVKAIGYGPLKRFASRWVHEAYHPSDATVVPVTDVARWVPNFWVLHFTRS